MPELRQAKSLENYRSIENLYLDISFSNFVTRFGDTDFDLNGFLTYKMRDIDFADGAFKGWQLSLAVRKEFLPDFDAGISVSYSTTLQRVSLVNHYNDADRQEGLSSFLIMAAGSTHRHINVGIPFQYRFSKRFFIEVLPSMSYNVSHWKYNPDVLNRNSPFAMRYESVIDNSIYVSDKIIFGRGALGYENRGFMAKLFYERNFSPVSTKFPFRGQFFAFDYPKWINWGILAGFSLNLRDNSILGEDRKR